MKLIYGVKDRPGFGKTLLFAFQQLLAILAATILVPALVGHDMSQSAALFGAGVGTLVYLLFTKFRSPVFLGSSFAFIGPMGAAFAGGVSMSLGYLGLLIGAGMAGLVYVIIALIVKFSGVKWINKIMPAVVIGPTVAIIGLSLSGNAIANSFGKGVPQEYYHVGPTGNGLNVLICIAIALITLLTVVICSVYGKKMAKMIPFIIGIVVGYIIAAIVTVIGNAAGVEAMKIIDFSAFANMKWLPDFTFLTAFKGGYTFGESGSMASYILKIAIAYVPVAFVVFAEHLADHKNISSIIKKDLLEDPGLHRTLLGDGIGSMAGAFFGGCPNTTYGESIGCVAISGNASVVTILTTSILAIVAAFIAPFTTFLSTIPVCVMGGVCISLYGFIAVSGLKMIQKVDLGDNHNLFVVSVILIAGVGGMVIHFSRFEIELTNIACALILGIITNLILSGKKKAGTEEAIEEKVEEASEEKKD
ncbi:MAG: uracil-xanthine permease [Clostridia bacterium]|nr:uracil-xanthine permease [Clostridia bacterium]